MTKNSETGKLTESGRLVKAHSRYGFSGITSELMRRILSKCIRMAALKPWGSCAPLKCALLGENEWYRGYISVSWQCFAMGRFLFSSPSHAYEKLYLSK